jgi:hypothetical protein
MGHFADHLIGQLGAPLTASEQQRDEAEPTFHKREASALAMREKAELRT